MYWSYEQGTQVADTTYQQFGDYYGRLVAHYVEGGFLDEYGVFVPGYVRCSACARTFAHQRVCVCASMLASACAGVWLSVCSVFVRESSQCPVCSFAVRPPPNTAPVGCGCMMPLCRARFTFNVTHWEVLNEIESACARTRDNLQATPSPRPRAMLAPASFPPIGVTRVAMGVSPFPRCGCCCGWRR